MRFAIVDPFGCGLSFAARLRDEGHDVKLYIDKGKGRERSDTHAHIGEGIVDVEPDFELLAEWAGETIDSIALFTGSGLGDKAEALRERGLIVVGGGTFCDRLENDRLFGFEIAEEAGSALPPYEEFSSLADVKKRAKTLDREIFFKTNRFIGADASRGCDTGDELVRYIDELRDQGVPDLTAGILQDKIDGVALSIARWWNGRAWVGPYELTIELKGYGNDDFGPSTGCSLNALWFADESGAAEIFDALGVRFREENAPPGIYDINFIVDDDGKYWFLEHTPRFGYDAEPISTRLIDDLGSWLRFVGMGIDGAVFSRDLAYAVRLSVQPYPWEHAHWADKKTCVGVRVNGTDGLWAENFVAYQVRQVPHGLEVASPEGIIGLSAAVGDRLSSLHDEAIEFADQLDCSGIFCRTDGAVKLKEIAERLKKAGVVIHEGMLK
jgi:phosphoribosylamine--glycine ligase